MSSTKGSFPARRAAVATLKSVPGRPEVLLAALIALTLTLRTPAASWLTFGAVLGLIAFPVVLHRFVVKPARAILIFVVLAAASGVGLAYLSTWEDKSRTINRDFFLFDLGSLVGLVLISLAGLWSVEQLGLRRFATLWAIGYLPVAITSTPLWSVNPWKFALAFPVTILALAVFAHSGRSVYVALAALAAISVVAGYRSWALGLLLAGLLCLVLPRSRAIRKLSVFSKFIVFGTLAAFSGWLVFELVLGGLFGESVRDRTILQLQWGEGNIVLGGRSEWGAALAGLEYNPLGFGAGVAPSAADWGPIIDGQRVPEGLKDVTTVAQYMSAGRIEFHSTLWNFWSHYGLAGLLLIAIIAVTLVLAAIQAGSTRKPSSLIAVVLSVQVLWNLLFSPTVIVTLGVALAIALWIKREGASSPSLTLAETEPRRSPRPG